VARESAAIQRVGKITPHDARKAAEARAAKAEGALADMVGRLEDVGTAPDGSWPGPAGSVALLLDELLDGVALDRVARGHRARDR
jgi:hypothetical protein